MCPQNSKVGGEQPTLANPPQVGPKTLVNPQPTGVGKRGDPGGRSPHGGGCGGCPPTKSKRGRVAHISNHATSRPHNTSEPSANKVGKGRGAGRALHIFSHVVYGLAFRFYQHSNNCIARHGLGLDNQRSFMFIGNVPEIL